MEYVPKGVLQKLGINASKSCGHAKKTMREFP
jgi:hypothetical protein